MKPIFIHSQYHSGGEFVWKNILEDKRFRCYYEPFHPLWHLVGKEAIDNRAANDGPANPFPLAGHFWEEFRGIIANDSAPGPGLEYIKKSFSFDEFCHIKQNSGIKKYIDALISGAGKKTPVFIFTRTAFRVRWFRVKFPGALNIYLVRNPQDQFQSIIEEANETGPDMRFIQDLTAACQNRENEPFDTLDRHLPLVAYKHEDFKKEEQFYRILAQSYSLPEKYTFFYFLWACALLENTVYADVVVDVNRLFQPVYRAKLNETIREKAQLPANWDNFKIRAYNKGALSIPQMEDIETRIQPVVYEAMPPEETETFFRRLSPAEKTIYRLDEKFALKKNNRKSKGYTPAERKTRYEHIIFNMADFYGLEAEKETKHLKKTGDRGITKLNQLENQLAEKETEKNNAVAEVKQELKKAKDDAGVLEQLLGENEKNTRALERQLKKKEGQLNAYADELEDKNQRIAQAEQELAENKSTITAVKLALSRKSEALAAAEKQIAAAHREAEGSRQTHEKNQLQLKQNAEKLSALEKQTQVMTEQIQALEKNLEEKEQHIVEILSSKAYKAGKTLMAPFSFSKRNR